LILLLFTAAAAAAAAVAAVIDDGDCGPGDLDGGITITRDVVVFGEITGESKST
jgi:hypothetical protein